MKKVIFVALMAIAFQANSQTLVSFRAGGSLFDGANYFGPGASVQRQLGEHFTAGLNLDYHTGKSSASFLTIEPRIDYFFDKSFQGFHIGSNIAYSAFSYTGGSSGFFNIGATAGYSKAIIGENIIFDATLGLGSMYGSGTSFFVARPALSLGYNF
jgi:hypothetical protein